MILESSGVPGGEAAGGGGAAGGAGGGGCVRAGRLWLSSLAPLLLVLVACGVGKGSVPLAEDAPCVLAGEAVELPRQLRETSGVDYSGLFPGMLWSHNDSGWEPILHAITRKGMHDGSLWVEGVAGRDWEAMEITLCQAGSCIWVADTGDNNENRTTIELVRVVEVEPGDDRRVPGERFPIVLPDGPRDIEAMYILPGERVFLVTKGRNHPVTVYRYPMPLRPGEAVTLEEVQVLSPDIPGFRDRVVGAAASDDGTVVVIRRYASLQFYTPDARGVLHSSGPALNLQPLQEPQGEAVAIGSGGEVVLTSEGGPFRSPPVMNVLRCEVVGG